MLARVLFGVRRSPQRKICVALAIVVVALGVAVGVAQGWAMGVPVVLIGLLAVAVLSRQTASHHEKTATQENLGRMTGEFDADALRHMVDAAPHDPNDQLARVTGQFDADDIRAAVAQVRG